MITSLLFSLIAYLLLFGSVPHTALLGGVLLLFVCGTIYQKKHGHSHGGFLSIDVQVQKSGLAGCHAGLKSGFCVLCAFVCIGANSIWVSLFVAISMTVLTILVGKTPAHYYFTLLSAPLSFILLGTLAILVAVSAAPMGLLDIPLGSFYLSVTPESQRVALLLTCRAFGALSCMYLLSLSTPMYELIGFLRRIHVPSLVIELMYLIYRYIFVLLETQQQMQIAAHSRLGYRGVRRSVRTLCTSSLNLLAISFRRSSDCFSAMEARCYDGEIAFLERDATLRKREVLAAVFYLLILIILWYIVRRLGA